MSWIHKLYETYENCSHEVGEFRGNEIVLLPLFHTTQQAQIEITIDLDGNFCFNCSKVIQDKKDATTIIPCTEKSAGRTNTPVPHLLFDKLQYIAGDYKSYGGSKDACYEDYITQLSEWCNSQYSHPYVCAVLTYLKKGTVIADLIKDGILFSENGKLLESWNGTKENTPPIFSVLKDQSDAFIRFAVATSDGSWLSGGKLWRNKEVWESCFKYLSEEKTDVDFCYVQGKQLSVSTMSPKKIRNAGDSAKLISSNDNNGYTYRGRFKTANEAFCIGKETTDKAHIALKWLITKQGFINGDQVILAFGTNGQNVPKPTGDSVETALDIEPNIPITDIKSEFAQEFKNALLKRKNRLKGDEEAVIIGLDSATPGRLSVFYYREMKEHELLSRIESWHKSCCWKHEYLFVDDGVDEKGKPKKTRVDFEGAPALKEIVYATYGSGVSDKLKKSCMERLLPCVIDNALIPIDIMKNLARNVARNRHKDHWEFQKHLGISCAIIRKYFNDLNRIKNKEEVWIMSLNVQEDDRSYLFGRALAYAQNLEKWALGQGDDGRTTNAQRLQEAFSRQPAKTWKVIYEKLIPYLNRLGRISDNRRDEMLDVISRIKLEDFNNKPLTEVYLLGYACQMRAFNEDRKEAALKKLEKENNKDTNTDNNSDNKGEN